MKPHETKSIRKAYHEGLVILVVEDYMVFSKEVRHALPQHQVLMARTIEDAQACYEESLPNLTFLDIDLPDGDGFALLDFIRARDPTAYIIILSGSKLQEDINKARQKGAQGYIIKPFTHAILNQHLNDYLATREKNIKALIAETEKRRLQAVQSTSQE